MPSINTKGTLWNQNGELEALDIFYYNKMLKVWTWNLEENLWELCSSLHAHAMDHTRKEYDNAFNLWTTKNRVQWM